MTTPVLVVQHLLYEWGKESRSGVPAAQRHQAPRWLRLPAASVDCRTCMLLHSARLTDRDGDAFRTPVTEVRTYDHPVPISNVLSSLIGSATGESSRVSVYPEFAEGGLRVRSYGDVPTSRRPLSRTFVPVKRMTELRGGQTARFEWNRRLPVYYARSTWRYRHEILNLALVPLPLSPKLFAAEPEHRVSYLRWLY